MADLFPAWTDQDIQHATHEGKIPLYRRWEDRLRSGQIGLDALMNLSAMASFSRDQRALDDHILSLLQED